MSEFTAKVTSKGQITVPKDIRDALKLEIGDSIVFRINIKEGSEEKIITIEKEMPTETCPICKGDKHINGKRCFVCADSGNVYKASEAVWPELMRLIRQSRKYNINANLANEDEIPQIRLTSSDYPQEIMEKAQDFYQKMLIENYSRRSMQDDSKFAIPSDVLLQQILDLLVTNGAKEEVQKWFRYERTI